MSTSPESKTFDPRIDEYHLLISSIPNMVHMARHAALNEAVSYRGFKVGAAAFGINEIEGRLVTQSAGNIKPNKHITTVCAEQILLGLMKKDKVTKILGIVVAATTDKDKLDDVNALSADTLVPCVACEDRFLHNPLMTDESIILTTGINDDIYQVQTYAELNTGYQNPKQDLFAQMPTLEGFDDWAKRPLFYDALVFNEGLFPESTRRPPAMLAKAAMSVSL